MNVRATIALLVGAAGFAAPALAQSEPFPPMLTLDELDGAIGFRVDPSTGTSTLGLAVAGMGDINGDGLDDFLLGAPLSQAVAYDAGEAFVVFGREGGFPSNWSLDELDGTNGFRLFSARPDDLLGWELAIAGDLNNDGFDDIAVGDGENLIIFGRDSTGPGAFPASVHIYELSAPDAVRLSAPRLIDPVARAGDFNGDGMDDLLAGFTGGAFVLFGREGGFPDTVDLDLLDGSDGVRINEAASRDWAGRALAPAGDVNGDGIDDIIIAAYQADSSVPDSGAAYVVFGRDASAGPAFPASFSLADLDGANGFKLAPPEIAGAGQVLPVAGAGDINADGVDDVIVGFREHFPTGGVFADGAAYVVFGRDTTAGAAFGPVVDLTALDGGDGFVLRGDSALLQAGSSVSGAGDLNNDGVADVVVGVPAGQMSPPTRVGAAVVLYGRADGAFPALLNLSDAPSFGGFIAFGEDVAGQAANQLAATGDVNGDGLDDLLIGAPFVDGGGAAYVVYGRDGGTCYADLDGDGDLTIFDFLAFQNLFDASDPTADCDGDGSLTLFDFLCFQNAFDAGCE